MPVIDLTEHFNNGTLATFLENLPKKSKNAALRALNQSADNIVGNAKMFVRVKTGACRDSIRQEPTSNGFIIVAGNNQVTYAAALEARYPYIRPALEIERPQIIPAIIAEIMGEIF